VTGLFAEDVNYTTCCIQMSHAINMAFANSDVSKMVGTNSVRRNTHAATIARAGREFHYLAAVDEMKAFLDNTFEPGRKISSRKDIDDQPGIIVFMDTSLWGVHTEIWLGDDFHQTLMKGNFASLKMPNVWFWSLGDPTLVDI
jgi:Type VI secretion system (T6SS), amidase effector protein 4